MKKILFRLLLQFTLLFSLSVQTVSGFSAAVFPDRLQILALLENDQLDALEELLLSFQSEYEQGTGDERMIAYILETLANSNPEYEAVLNDWVVSHSGKYVPRLVRAYYYYGVAWSWRGHRDRKDTSLIRLEKMTDFLQLAAGDITRATQLKPQLSAADALSLKILMMLDGGEYIKQTLQEALDISPASYLVRSSYLWSLRPEWDGQPDELMRFMKETGTMLRKYPQLRPLMGYADYIFADSLAEQKRFKEAADHYDFAVKKGEDHINYRERGINYYHLQDYDKAMQDFDHALIIWPQDPRVLRWRARTLQRMQQDEAALADLDLAVRLAPMERYTLMAHALLSRKMKRYEQVLDDYENALFYNREDADIWFARGMHYSHELINFEAAGIDLKRATELGPDNPAYWYEYAAVLHYQLDCNIVVPLEQYRKLCKTGGVCRASELKWVRHAQHWLEENNRCEGVPLS